MVQILLVPVPRWEKLRLKDSEFLESKHQEVPGPGSEPGWCPSAIDQSEVSGERGHGPQSGVEVQLLQKGAGLAHRENKGGPLKTPVEWVKVSRYIRRKLGSRQLSSSSRKAGRLSWATTVVVTTTREFKESLSPGVGSWMGRKEGARQADSVDFEADVWRLRTVTSTLGIVPWIHEPAASFHNVSKIKRPPSVSLWEAKDPSVFKNYNDYSDMQPLFPPRTEVLDTDNFLRVSSSNFLSPKPYSLLGEW